MSLHSLLNVACMVVRYSDKSLNADEREGVYVGNREQK